MIGERIDKLKPYFKGLKITDNYSIVEVIIKKSWVFDEDEDILFQNKEVKENSNLLYYMFYSDTKTFDNMLDYIEEFVIKHNLEIEEKENLLRAKVEELKRVFESKSLEELNNLKFTTEEESLKLGMNNKPKKQENVVTEELSTNSES